MIHCMIRLINQGGNSHVNRNRTESKRKLPISSEKMGTDLKNAGLLAAAREILDEEG